MSRFNSNDQERWNQIFKTPQAAWKEASEQTFMLDALNLFKSHGVHTILDIGCGVGVWSLYLAKKGFDVYGTDFSANAIGLCREWAEEKKLVAQFEVAAITSDPWPAKKFDAAVASMILDNVVRAEMDQAIPYTDEEVLKAFPGFNVLSFQKYPIQGLDFRGVAFQRS
jgi:2-polyprenyl-3-methyl-5-hydroxy-6-metoxy-1,4-benzoquinol methylase